MKLFNKSKVSLVLFILASSVAQCFAYIPAGQRRFPQEEETKAAPAPAPAPVPAPTPGVPTTKVPPVTTKPAGPGLPAPEVPAPLGLPAPTAGGEGKKEEKKEEPATQKPVFKADAVDNKAMANSLQERVLAVLPQAAAPFAGLEERVKISADRFAQLASISQTNPVSCAYQSVFDALVYLNVFNRNNALTGNISNPLYTLDKSNEFKNLAFNIFFAQAIASGSKKPMSQYSVNDPVAPTDEELRAGLQALQGMANPANKQAFFDAMKQKGVAQFGDDVLALAGAAEQITVLPMDAVGRFVTTMYKHTNEDAPLSGGLLGGIPGDDINYLNARLGFVADKFARGEKFMHAFVVEEFWKQRGIGHYAAILVGNNDAGRFMYVLNPLNRMNSGIYGPANFPFGNFSGLKDVLRVGDGGGLEPKAGVVDGMPFLHVQPYIEIINKVCFAASIEAVPTLPEPLKQIIDRVRDGIQTQARAQAEKNFPAQKSIFELLGLAGDSSKVAVLKAMQAKKLTTAGIDARKASGEIKSYYDWFLASTEQRTVQDAFERQFK